MDFFYLYLLGTIGLVFFPFIIILFVAWLINSCTRFVDPVRHQRRSLSSHMHPATWQSLWPRRNSSRANIPLTTRGQSPIVATARRMPHEAHQSNAMTNAPSATNRSQRSIHLPSGSNISNTGIDTPPANEQSSNMVPMPRGCRTHQSNVLPSIPLPTPQPQTMTPMRYGSHPSNGRTDVPVTILQSQIMAHINHGRHQSQTMTPMRYGSQTNARAHTPYGPHYSNSRINVPHANHQTHMMTPEPRERPITSRNSDIGAYISASIYRKCESDKNTECAICLAKLKRGEMVMQMPVCSHLYHEKCICRWLLQEPSCPLCRSPVRGQLSVRVGHS